METSGFFNAERLANGNYDRVYLAANFASYFASFIGNGVFGGKMAALQVISNGAFGVSVQSGQGFINGYWYQNDSSVTFSLAAGSAQPRIDTVVLRLNFISRTISLGMLTGTPSVSPAIPTLTRNDNTWELGLANINIPAGATSITPQDIIDTRLDMIRCGFVHGVVDQLDTTEYGNRLNGFIESYIAQASTDYQSQFTEPITALVSQANSGYTAFRSGINELTTQSETNFSAFQSGLNTISGNAQGFYTNTFLPSINATQALATAAFNDFTDWIASKKVSSTQTIQDLVDQLNDIISAGDVGALLVRIDALYALQADTPVASIEHNLGQYPVVTVYEYQGGTMGVDGIVTDATLTLTPSSYDQTDENNIVVRVKAGYGTVNEVTKVTDSVYTVDFSDSDWNLYIKLTTVIIVDALDSTDTNSALSANQGRVLDENKVDKAIPSAVGNLARLDSDGNIFDSGSPTTLPSGNAGGDLTGMFPNPTLNVLNPVMTPSSDSLDYGDPFTTDTVTVDNKGRVLWIDRNTLTLPPLPFNIYATESAAAADDTGLLALFPL